MLMIYGQFINDVFSAIQFAKLGTYNEYATSVKITFLCAICHNSCSYDYQLVVFERYFNLKYFLRGKGHHKFLKLLVFRP